MGFEQLAELRAQLAAKAKQERNAKRPAAPADTGAKPKSGDQPQRGAKPAAAGGKAAHRAKPASAKPAAPVDPVIVAIGKLQRKFPRAFPKNPAPKCRSRSVSGTTSHVKHRPSSQRSRTA